MFAAPASVLPLSLPRPARRLAGALLVAAALGAQAQAQAQNSAHLSILGVQWLQGAFDGSTAC